MENKEEKSAQSARHHTFRTNTAIEKPVTSNGLQMSALFNDMLEHFPLPVTLSDFATGEILAVNDLVIKKLDIEREEITGIPSSKLFYSPINRQKYLSMLEQYGKVEGLNVHLNNQKGKLFWAEIYSIPVLIDEYRRILSVIVDVTEKKESGEKLDYSLKLLQTLLNTTNIAVLVEDDKRDILHANVAFTKLFQIAASPEQLKGLNCNELGSSMVDFFTDGPTFLDRVSKILKKKVPVTNELIQCNNGNILKRSYFPIELKANIIGSLWQYEDVTIQVRQQKELIKSKEDLQTLLTSLEDIIFELDENLYFTNYWCKNDQMLMIPPHEFMGRKMPQVFSKQFNSDFFTPFYQILIDGKTRNIEYPITMPDGSAKWFNAKLNLIQSEPVQQKRLVLAIQDISTRKKGEEDILAALEKEKHLNELKSRFVTMTSHEFKTPLTAIKSSAELIELNTAQTDPEVNASVQRHVKIISKEVDRLSRLINDILILGKLEANKISFNPCETDLLEICRDVIEQVVFTQPDGRTIKLVTNGSPRPVFVDPSQMNHILNNLLSNALKYSQGKPEPEIRISWENNQFEVTVKDEGIGIPEADLKNIFESFYRATNVTGINGTGLGLVLVKNFVNLHHGHIDLVSKPYEGTVFTIRINDINIKKNYEKSTDH